MDDKEKLNQYLLQQLERRRRQDDPEYRKNLNADVMGMQDAASGNNLAALLMDSASMAGTLNGKRSDASGVARFAQAQNENLRGFQGAMAGAEQDRENRYQMDQKVREYLAAKQQAAENQSATAQYRKDTLAQNKKLREDEMALRERLAKSRPAGGGITPYQKFQMEQAVENKKNQNEERLEKKVAKVGDDLGNSQEVFSAIGAAEDQIGLNLEDKDKHKDVDLPGFSLPGIGRVTAFSSDARLLQSRIAKIFNTVLKDRSGAAVTDTELERLRQEFAAGKFNTESEMLGALAEYKAAASRAMQNIEAKHSPESIARYREQGGKTYQDFSQRKAAKLKPAEGEAIADTMDNENVPVGTEFGAVPPGKVRVVSPEGKIGLIPASQLQDALKEGYKEAK